MFKFMPEVSLLNAVGSDDPTACPLCHCKSLLAGKPLGWGYYRELKRSFSTGYNRNPDSIMVCYECPCCYEKICFHTNNTKYHDGIYDSVGPEAWEEWKSGGQPHLKLFGNCKRCRKGGCASRFTLLKE